MFWKNIGEKAGKMIEKIILKEEAKGIKYNGFNYHEIEDFLSEEASGWITNINDSTKGKLDEIIVSYSDHREIVDIHCKIGDYVTIDEDDNIQVKKAK